MKPGLGKQTSFQFAVCSFSKVCRFLLLHGKQQKILLFAFFRGQKIVCFLSKAKKFAFAVSSTGQNYHLHCVKSTNKRTIFHSVF